MQHNCELTNKHVSNQFMKTQEQIDSIKAVVLYILQHFKDGVDYIVNPELALESSGKASQIIKVGLDSEIKIIRASVMPAGMHC